MVLFSRALGARERRWFALRRSALASILALLSAVAGCAGAGTKGHPATTPSATEVHNVRSYWNLDRLDSAIALGQHHRNGKLGAKAVIRVGALFSTSSQGAHFCTASPVKSPGGNLIITAAHCVYSNGRLNGNIAFVPGYRRGKTPYGVWLPKTFVVDDDWKRSANPALDVAFIVLQPQDGKHVANALGANAISFNTSYQQDVRVTGYPQSADAPITCVNTTTEQSTTQLKFPCDGFTGGTSGSPWVVRASTRTLTGTIVGVIGGYQQGGDTADISYSPYFGSAIQRLYQQAISADS